MIFFNVFARCYEKFLVFHENIRESIDDFKLRKCEIIWKLKVTFIQRVTAYGCNLQLKVIWELIKNPHLDFWNGKNIHGLVLVKEIAQYDI